LSDLIPTLPELGKAEAAAILSGIATLEGDPALLAALQRRTFIEKGLQLVEGPDCPLCDHPWENEDHLRKHLQEKLGKSEQSTNLQASLLKHGGDLVRHLTRLRGLVAAVNTIATAESSADCALLTGAWLADLDSLKSSLTTVDGLLGLKDRLARGWAGMPKAVIAQL